MKKFLLLIFTVLIVFLTNVSSQTSHVGETLQQTVERKIFKEIIKLPYYGVFDYIGYKLDGETVTLFGKVTVARNKKDAEYAVKKINGVQQIINDIEILPLSGFDNSIRINLLRTFANRTGSFFRYLQEPNPSVRIIVNGGHVTLEGYVANRGDYNTMNILANGIADVFSVKNNLIVEKEAVR